MIGEELLRVDEAQRRLLELAPAPTVEPVTLGEAAGLVLAAPVVARRALPGFDNSAMDGFAVHAADVHGATAEVPARLKLVGEVAAGAVFPGRVSPGEAVRIMTGAPMPSGADAVVEVEQSRVAGGHVMLWRDAEPGLHVRPAGGDIAPGEVALPAGAHLGPAQLALLAALGETRPTCVARPRVAIVATGDELVEPGEEPGPGQVVNIVGTALGAAIAAAGATPVVVARARDSLADVRRALTEAMERADIVVSVGGVSMGEYDLVRPVVEELGGLDFWKVAMRPGKPLAVGRVGARPFVGLPGNPVSALVGMEVYVLPMLLALSGRAGWARPRVQSELAQAISTPEGLRTFVRARLRPGADGVPLAEPVAGQGSHQLRWLAASNCLLDIPEATTSLDRGARVSALLVDQPPAPPL